MFIFLVTFFALLLQSLYVFAYRPNEFVFIPYILLLAGGVAFFLNHSKSQSREHVRFETNIFLWAFSLRLWAGFIFYGWRFSEDLGDEDASGYIGAWAFAENWHKFGLDAFLSDLHFVTVVKQNLGQTFLWAIPTFFAGGESRMIVSSSNAFAGALLVLIIFRLSLKLFDFETAKIAALLATFWPSIVLFSGGTSKEILVILLSWATLYVVSRNDKALAIFDGIWASIFSFLLFTIRFYAVYMVAAAVLFRFFTLRPKHIVRNTVVGTLGVGVVAVFLIYSGAIDRDFERLEVQSQIIGDWRKAVADDTGSGVKIYSEYESATVAIPIATAYFFLAPFPWEVFSGSGRSMFAAIENVVIIVILVLGFRAVRVFFSVKFFEILPILVFCTLYAGFHIWGMSNVGLAWRHKQTVMPLLFILVAYSVSKSNAAWAIMLRNIGSKKEKLHPAIPRSVS